jgi:hypothetical protein
MSKKRRKTKKSDAEFAMSRGFPTVSDKVFDRVKQESRVPIIASQEKRVRLSMFAEANMPVVTSQAWPL